MSKNNNLKDFLADVADAIRSKTGESRLINPQDFSAKIASIQTGSSLPTLSVSKKDVTFYDYDGSVVYSYSKDAFLALSAMPELPTRAGLICQEWNWSFEDAQEYVGEYGKLNVGATYITDDGKTRLYVSVPRGKLSVPICFNQTVANGVTINWGDGSDTQTLSGTGTKNTTHTYEKTGEYVISLDPIDDCILVLGGGSSSNTIMGSTSSTMRANNNMLKKVEIGRGVESVGFCAFYYCYSLESISIPNGVTFSNWMFRDCYSLSSIVIPNGVTSINDQLFNNCYSLATVVIPNSVTSVNVSAFNYNYSLENIVIPNSVTSIGNSAFKGCLSLSSVVIPNSVTNIADSAFYNCYSLATIVSNGAITSIGDSAFYNCYSLASIVIPNGVTSISRSAFYNCYCATYCDLSQCTSVPTLGTNVFYSFNGKIIVPDALYDEWISATNWSSYASKIIKKSDWDASQS